MEKSPEHEEAADQVDVFVGDILDAIGGVDPHTGAETPFTSEFEIEIVLTEDTTATIVGTGQIGQPRKKSLRGYVVGDGRARWRAPARARSRRAGSPVTRARIPTRSAAL